ncbi:MAG TPA: hypothetical protein P5056_02550 [Candidatus Paceibacterota bacterium]|nr:hypothetical protein [Candidatus Paceibacterota bacterium]
MQRYCRECKKETEHKRRYLGDLYKCTDPKHKDDPTRCPDCGNLLDSESKPSDCTDCYYRKNKDRF